MQHRYTENRKGSMFLHNNIDLSVRSVCQRIRACIRPCVFTHTTRTHVRTHACTRTNSHPSDVARGSGSIGLRGVGIAAPRMMKEWISVCLFISVRLQTVSHGSSHARVHVMSLRASLPRAGLDRSLPAFK